MDEETFTKALDAAERFDGSKDVRAWLFTIAKNTYYSRCRREHFYADGELQENTEDSRPGVIEQLVDAERALDIHHFLHRMEEPYKREY